MDLLLYPVPRSLAFSSGTVPGDAPVQRLIDPALAGDEAYRLVIGGGAVRLSARTATGLRWADATLAQIRAQHPRDLPCLTIDDAPRVAQRGVMLDISRDRVPTLATLMELVDLIAALKGNHLQLYVEHTLAYRGHQDAWRSASPLSLEGFVALDAYAAGKGVALTANQNCLGHFERWLRHPRYASLAEIAAPRMHNGDWYVEPNTLCPEDPAALALVRDLLEQQLPLASGAFANIGCDEPWDLGQGRSQQVCDTVGRKKVFSRWVTAVAAIARGLGKRPQFWCDPHPNEDDGLPKDLIALVWGYDPESDFATRCAAHRALGRSVWVCPGTGCWNSTTGRTAYRRANLARAAAEPADGFLVTAWGDSGHLQPWPVTLAGIADGLHAAWGGTGFSDRALGLAAFGDPAVGEWLAALGDADRELTHQVRNTNALMHDLRSNLADLPGVGSVADWSAVAARLEPLEAAIPPGPWAAECAFAVRSARWAADRAVQRRGSITVEQRRDLAQRMCDLIADHRRQWLARCGYGGLEDSCQHLKRHTMWY